MVIAQATGDKGQMTLVDVNLSVIDGAWMRFGSTPEEVALAEWRPYQSTFEWWMKGDTNPGPFVLYGEVRQSDNTVVSVEAEEPARIPGVAYYHPDSSYADSFTTGNEAWTSYGYLYYTQPDGSIGEIDHDIGSEIHANTFFPMTHEDGRVWVDDSRWTLDTPEVVNGGPTVLAALTYARWHNGNTQDYVNFQNVTVTAALFGESLDLKGGDIDFWVTTALGRWHFTYDLQLGNNRFDLRTDYAAQSWSRNGNPLGSEALNLAQVESWGFGFNSFTGEPTGVFGIDDIAFGYEFVGKSGQDYLYGVEGNDKVYGLEGNDLLWGMSGDDMLIGGIGADVLTGGVGTDSTSYHTSSQAVRVDLVAKVGYGGDAQGDMFGSVEQIIGSLYNDTITGDNANNELHGLAGNDSICGGTGSDFLDGGEGNDCLWGNEGDDRFRGREGSDIFTGGTGTDSVLYNTATTGIALSLRAGSGTGGEAAGDLYGSIENVIGSLYNDVIGDDNGANRLTGCGGNDQFVFGDVSGSDVITDFNDGDIIDLSNVSSVGSFGDVSVSQVGAHVLIAYGANTLTLENVTAGNIDAGDFAF